MPSPPSRSTGRAACTPAFRFCTHRSWKSTTASVCARSGSEIPKPPSSAGTFRFCTRFRPGRRPRPAGRRPLRSGVTCATAVASSETGRPAAPTLGIPALEFVGLAGWRDFVRVCVAVAI